MLNLYHPKYKQWMTGTVILLNENHNTLDASYIAADIIEVFERRLQAYEFDSNQAYEDYTAELHGCYQNLYLHPLPALLIHGFITPETIDVMTHPEMEQLKQDLWDSPKRLLLTKTNMEFNEAIKNVVFGNVLTEGERNEWNVNKYFEFSPSGIRVQQASQYSTQSPLHIQRVYFTGKPGEGEKIGYDSKQELFLPYGSWYNEYIETMKKATNDLRNMCAEHYATKQINLSEMMKGEINE